MQGMLAPPIDMMQDGPAGALQVAPAFCVGVLPAQEYETDPVVGRLESLAAPVAPSAIVTAASLVQVFVPTVQDVPAEIVQPEATIDVVASTGSGNC